MSAFLTPLVLASLAGGTFGPSPVLPGGQDVLVHPDTLPAPAPVGREALRELEIPPLHFEPPDAEEHEVLGVPVFHFHDPSLPLVDFHVHVPGGAGHFPRSELAAATALPGLLRSGGTLALPPDSVERRLDLMALQIGVQSGGGGTFVSLNAVTAQAGPGIDLLGEMLLEPGFDGEAVEVWRTAELERVRRRADDPTGLAYSEFNRLLFGDHPVGWVTEETDLTPDRLAESSLRELHGILFCRDRVTLGMAGDLAWDEAEPLARAFLERWPECAVELPEPPLPEIRREGAVFVLPRAIDQSTVIVAGPGGVQQEASPEYFASRVGNHVLGGGGLGSRLSSRVRTQQGLAYWASSLWTAPLRYEGIVGAVTATGADRTVDATLLLLEVLTDFRDRAPSEEEVDHATRQLVNGFVFAFESPSQIVSRRIAYRIQDLPPDWLEAYLEGLRSVTPESVYAVAREHVNPGEMTVLIVGDPERFAADLESLGRVYELRPDGSYRPWVNGATGSPSEPRESPRSQR